MKRILGVLFLLFLISSISRTSPQDYDFYLVWEKDFWSVLGHSTHFVDIDGGLLEIFVIGKTSKEEDPGFFVLNAFGEKIFRREMFFNLKFFFTDLENDGFKEIFYFRRIPLNEKREERLERIEVLNHEGILLWSYDYMKTSELLYSLPDFIFHDINDDGLKEIFVGNLIFDAEGNVIQTFDEFFNCVGVGDFNDDGEIEVLLLKEFYPKETLIREQTFEISDLEGEVLWEYQVVQEHNFEGRVWTQLLDLDGDGKKELIFFENGLIYRLNPNNFSEKIVILKLKEEVAPGWVYPFLEIKDIGGDGNQEYLVLTQDWYKHEQKFYVFDENKRFLWEYENMNWDMIEERDLENDGKLEFFFSNSKDFDVDLGVFDVLNYDGKRRWGLIFNNHVEFEVWDVNLDGEKEIIAYDSLARKESFINIFNPQGELIKRFEIEQYSTIFFHDFDNDKDLDFLVLTYTEDFSKGKLSLYSNSLNNGPLDEISNRAVKLQGADLEKAGFEDFDRIKYEWRRLSRILKKSYTQRNPFYLIIKYRTQAKFFFGFFTILFMTLSLYLTRFFKKKESKWEILWSFKKVILYFIALMLLSLLALIYFLYKILKSSEDYKKALGFVKITKRQIFITIVIGLILFFASSSLTVLFALSDIKLPDISRAEYLIKNYLLFAILLMVITESIGEEIIFSSYLYPILRNKLGVKLGIFSIASLFSVMHLEPVFISIFFIESLIKTYIYEKTHCIYVPMIIHFIHNSIVVALIYFT
ncbi:MAG: lysostaphin resistance A-like protein [Candidatus Methanofastidiosia archaeon]